MLRAKEAQKALWTLCIQGGRKWPRLAWKRPFFRFFRSPPITVLFLRLEEELDGSEDVPAAACERPSCVVHLHPDICVYILRALYMSCGIGAICLPTSRRRKTEKKNLTIEGLFPPTCVCLLLVSHLFNSNRPRSLFPTTPW